MGRKDRTWTDWIDWIDRLLDLRSHNLCLVLGALCSAWCFGAELTALEGKTGSTSSPQAGRTPSLPNRLKGGTGNGDASRAGARGRGGGTARVVLSVPLCSPLSPTGAQAQLTH